MAVDSHLKYETQWEENAGVGTDLEMRPSPIPHPRSLSVDYCDKPCHGLLFPLCLFFSHTVPFSLLWGGGWGIKFLPFLVHRASRFTGPRRASPSLEGCSGGTTAGPDLTKP